MNPSDAAPPGADQFLIQGEDVANGALSAHISGNPAIRELDRVAPDVVVLSMPRATSLQLKAHFGDRLVIEPNSDLVPPM